MFISIWLTIITFGIKRKLALKPARERLKNPLLCLYDWKDPVKIMRLEKDKFLTELTRLYDKTKEKGSVFITMKRCTFCSEWYETISDAVYDIRFKSHFGAR